MNNCDVVSEAKKLGINQIGFCSAKDFSDEYKTVICAAFPYYIGEKRDSNISKYCFGLDYHKVIGAILNSLAEALLIDDFKAFCDIGKNDDRKIAYMCGLGFYGMNSLIINEEYGSYFFIGYIFCNIPLEYSVPLQKSCYMCGECKKNCPGGAINGDFTIDCEKCLSHITQKKGELSENEIKMICDNGSVFGCDICQNVCPHNKNAKKTDFCAFSQNLVTSLSYEEISVLSNKEFAKKYSDRAFAWRGKKVLERNLMYIKNANCKK